VQLEINLVLVVALQDLFVQEILLKQIAVKCHFAMIAVPAPRLATNVQQAIYQMEKEDV